MTSDFPAWAGGFATQVHRLRTTVGPALHQFELLFTPWIVRWRLAQQDEGPHSRNRRWNLRLVFWTFLWQVAQAGTPCREAIRQAQALCRTKGQPLPPDENSPYCTARGALPLERLQEIHDGLVTEADAAVVAKDLWCGHRAFVVDGSTLTAPDTEENQKAFPQQASQQPGCGFPILRLLAFMSLATGLLTSWATADWYQSELGLFQTLWDCLRAGDVLLADRGFCNWGVLAQCLRRQVHPVFRVKGIRRRDFRRGKHLSRDERLVQWEKPRQCSATISAKEWARLPQVLSLRLVRCRMDIPGFRTRQIILVTTLLDWVKYPASALGRLYYRRWAMELTLRNLKTTLQMEHLSCKNPENLEREIRMHFLVHNLVRRLMLESSRLHRVPLERVSFAGSLAATRRYAEALLQARSESRRQELYEALLRVLAQDLLPLRPGRREPRAVKRRPKPYPSLTCHRSRFREISHRNRYWNQGPSKRKKAKYIRAN
jgi:hypothetical protein